MTPEKKSHAFLNHLEDLRSCLLRCLVACTLCSIAAYNFAHQILFFLIKPIGQVVFLSPSEAFIATMTITFLSGLLISSPYSLYQIWMFVAEALTEFERRYLVILLPASLLLFLLGGLFGYFVIVPLSLKFFLGFAFSSMIPMITLGKYISFVGGCVLSFGLIFELPLIITFLSAIGIASPAFLRHQRRYAIVIIFIISTILTPPDVISQLLMAIPLLVLYELSVLLSKLVYREKSPVPSQQVQ